jgi:hypothetical protein
VGYFPYVGLLGEGERVTTHHEALGDIRRCAAICFVLVRVADLERVDDGGEPVDQLVEVHAWCGLARRGCPVVLGEPEKVVELRVDQGCNPSRCARLGFAEGRCGCEADRATALCGAGVIWLL